MKKWILLALLIVGPLSIHAQRILIPMDSTQNNHLKAYGITFWALESGMSVEWLLNYRGGTFLLDYSRVVFEEAAIRGVTCREISETDAAVIYAEIDAGNMDVVLLEKAPKIAVYTPPNKQPWDDAVTLALEYAQIKYDKIWDEEVLNGRLGKYDWLHLHHEDFTGQYGKFFSSYRHEEWYRSQQRDYEAMATRLGFEKVSDQKKAVAQLIYRYVIGGGFLFAMCSATDTFDIALSTAGVDICHEVFDGDPSDANAQAKLDFSRTLAFHNFTLESNPLVYEYSDIDMTPKDMREIRTAEAEYFSLFEFSAKYDPVPTMLTQSHSRVVNGFLGQTTAFKRSLIKDSVVILGDIEKSEQVRYVHGQAGKGTFTFFGGHDPEDHKHLVHDPPTNLALHPNSPGYRLILNNVLFPAAKKKERKT